MLNDPKAEKKSARWMGRHPSDLFVVLFGYPQLFEGSEVGHDGATDSYRVFTLFGSNNLDLQGRWNEGGNLIFLHLGRIGPMDDCV